MQNAKAQIIGAAWFGVEPTSAVTLLIKYAGKRHEVKCARGCMPFTEAKA